MGVWDKPHNIRDRKSKEEQEVEMKEFETIHSKRHMKPHRILTWATSKARSSMREI